MKLKINWGTGIVIAIIIMVSGMSFLVYKATRQDYYLVDKDYYQKAINYQQQIDKMKNANSLTEKVKISQSTNELKVEFPSIFSNKIVEGTINLYSPVSDRYDLNMNLKLDTSLCQFVSLKELPKGRYKVKLDWKADEKEFYQELEIMHP